MNIWFYSFCTLEFLKLWFLFLFTMSERIKIGLGSSKKVPTEQNSTLVHLFLKSKSYRNQCIVSYFLCISIVSGLESRGLSKLFIVNAKGLLKLILHFFLTYSYFLHSFFEFFITIYNRHICSLYHSLVHFTISCTQWRHLCVVRLHHICEAPRHFLFTFSRPLCLKLE